MVGVGAIFWHFSRLIGISFIAVSVAGLVLMVIWRSAMDELNRPKGTLSSRKELPTQSSQTAE